MEWTNLAADPKYTEIKKAHAKFLPGINAPDIGRAKMGKNNRRKKAKQQDSR